MTHSSSPLIGSDKHRIIVGLGQTGLSIARFFHQQGLDFSVLDSRENPPGLEELLALKPDVNTHFGSLDEDFLAQATQLVVSPGICIQTPLFRELAHHGIEIVGDIELFCLEANAPIVAITGSNAKSTVTTLVGKMAQDAGVKVAVGGNLGLPALDLLSDDVELYVLELSSFQLETTENLNAEVATVLNVSADHLDRYESYLAYQQSKHRIFSGAKHLVINDADALSKPMMADDFPYLGFKLDAPEFKRFSTMQVDGEWFLSYEFKPLLSVRDMKIFGKHNQENALAALALGKTVNLPMKSMLQTLQSFNGLKHRCQWLDNIHGVDYINDSKGTNVGATLAAIEGLSKAEANIILIAGGVSKGADLSPLVPALKQSVKRLITIGLASDELSALSPVDTVCANDLEQALQLANEISIEGDTVLFSPACASFDMFKNFEHRGECFIEAVDALKADNKL